MSYVKLSEGESRRFTLLACGPDSPESSRSDLDMATKRFTFCAKAFKASSPLCSTVFVCGHPFRACCATQHCILAECTFRACLHLGTL